MAEKFNFIKSKLDALSFDPALGKSKNYYGDEKLPGLLLEITPKNLKSFQVYKKVNNKPIRVLLGRYPDMTIEQARRLAQGKLSEMAEGIDPNAKKKADKNRQVTLSEAFADYLKIHNTLKPKTVLAYRYMIDNYLKDWKDKPIASITGAKVVSKHTQISETAKATANTVMRLLHSLFKFAAANYKDENERAIFIENPVNDLSGLKKWNKIKPRERHIKDFELKPFLNVVMALAPEDGYIWQQAKVFFLVTLFTGCRREEGLSLKWSNVDLTYKTLTFDDTKNGKKHVLPLSDFLLNVLTEYRENTLSKSEYLLPTPLLKNGKPHSKSGHISNPQRYIEKITERTGIKFSDHDLRRTFATAADEVGYPLHKIKRLLNHAEQGTDVTLGYIMRNVNKVRAPMQQITDYILQEAGMKQTAKIIPLERKTA